MIKILAITLKRQSKGQVDFIIHKINEKDKKKLYPGRSYERSRLLVTLETGLMTGYCIYPVIKLI